MLQKVYSQFLWIVFILILSNVAHGMDNVQTIRGRVIDKYSKSPIEGVAVELLNYLPRKVALTDEKGKFKIEGRK